MRHAALALALLPLPLAPLPAAAHAPVASSASEWVGLFEGHGVAPPEDPSRARAATRAAQRLGTQCTGPGATRGGGLVVDTALCGGAKKELARLGPDAAAAILDELDSGEGSMVTFRALIDNLARTGRADVATPLATALERIAARGGVEDPRVRDHGRHEADAIEEALKLLTFADPNALPRLRRKEALDEDARLKESAAGWRRWLEAHRGQDRAAWKAGEIAAARAAVKGKELDAAVVGMERLLEIDETRAEGVTAWKALRPRVGWVNQAGDAEKPELRDLAMRLERWRAVVEGRGVSAEE